MSSRVYAYVEHEGKVAVFVHAGAPEAGLQVPGGGVEPGETPEEAVVRETLEEAGLGSEVLRSLGTARRRHWDPIATAVGEVERQFLHLRPLAAPPTAWSWVEQHASDGSGPITFEFRWLSVPDAAEQLDFGFGDLLAALDAEVAVRLDENRAAADTVRLGYDALAEAYIAWSRATDPANHRHRLLDTALAAARPQQALDLGCGTGDLATRYLIERGIDVVGLDLSEQSVTLATKRHPDAHFVHGDMTAFSFPTGHFDLITAFNSVIHVPRRLHARLFRDVHRWLTPGGLFVLNVEQDGRSGPGWTERWIDDVPMYWSAWPADATIDRLRAAGLTVLSTEVDDVEGFLWITCQKAR